MLYFIKREGDEVIAVVMTLHTKDTFSEFSF